MKPHPLQTTNPKREKGPLMLEPAELALNRSMAPVELAAALGLARDERMQPIRLDPHGHGLALADRAAPFRRLALEVGSGESPRDARPASLAIMRRNRTFPWHGFTIRYRMIGTEGWDVRCTRGSQVMRWQGGA